MSIYRKRFAIDVKLPGMLMSIIVSDSDAISDTFGVSVSAILLWGASLSVLVIVFYVVSVSIIGDTVYRVSLT